MSAQFPHEQSESGEFERQEDAFREWISADGSTPHPAEADRYHLYVSLACPWASRTLIVRKLKGLEDAIGMTVVDPVRDERGWAFRDGPGHSTDPINGFQFLSEAYRRDRSELRRSRHRSGSLGQENEADREQLRGRYLPHVQQRLRQIREKQSARSFPADISAEQSKLSDFIYDRVNNGVYKAGFATRQRPYEISCRKLFEALDELENRLTNSRYLFNNRIVESDWQLFCTLVRFDVVYYIHFKCSVRRILDYPNLQGYLMDLYQQPGISETVNFDHIKRHYYITHVEINPTRIVPIGPVLNLSQPHGRDRRFA